MRKRLTAAIFGSGAVALAIGLGATTAMATTVTTWTISPGGSVTGSAGTTTLKDKVTGTTLSCTSSSTAAKLKSGTGLTNPLGKITSVTFSNCTGPGGLAFTATTSASSTNPWKLKGSSFLNGVTHGSITGIMASISGSGCSATIAGLTATSNGKVTGTYTNSTGILKISGGGNLHIWNVSGCFGAINSGDASGFTGSYTISPKQTITSP
jgi:hypothetical protein